MALRPHPLWHRLGGLALWAAALGWALLALRVVTHTPLTLAAGLTVGLSLLGGWVFADLLSGLVHYWADELADERMPWLGRNLIVPFREHHTDPLAMTKHDVSETNGDNALGALLLLVPFGLLAPAAPQTGAQLAAYGALLGLALGVLLTNQIHKWAHTRRVPRLVRVLQRRHLLLSPVWHAQHHRAHDRAYCITAGWCNAVLDRVLTRPRHAHRPAASTPGASLEPPEKRR